MDSVAHTLETNLRKARFFKLWDRCLRSDADASAAAVWENVTDHYGELRRGYHGCDHIRHCLSQLDLVGSFIDDPDAVEMAIWFHDVIHQPGTDDNEKRSADLFVQSTERYFPREFVEKVYKLILMTRHQDIPKSDNEAFLLDIDMASFGLPWDEFLHDSKALRLEDSAVPDEVYYPAKLRFLRALLERPRIYFSEFFYARYEAKARENIQRYISQLAADGYR